MGEILLWQVSLQKLVRAEKDAAVAELGATGKTNVNDTSCAREDPCLVHRYL